MKRFVCKLLQFPLKISLLVGLLVFLHLRSFKTPPSGAVMSDEDDADCAFSMRKGVKTASVL